ncbi:preprotein translocase subunit YajC [Candidatus Igneacidithiobacillus taiwanensis]|uniref:preprotein translocase subunit YajC n=1 Tax=Candidatus Igneacidithiobacillus taiwanensis TaxID=1945924 RepID=UPI0028A0C3A1|nr:preprotein translocase subunit YajC [Candidatus Igneacidithiobacillus taiwanensis]MCE5359980.1 preprotein translocase subunit YajC [Acidithiobacillus sp.]
MDFSPIATAHAATTAAGSGMDSMLFQILPLIFIFAIFYFLLIRPQSQKLKAQRELIASVAKGDEVVTSGGLAGRVMQAGEEYLHVEIAENTVVKIQRSAVSMVLPKGTLKKL